MLIVYAGSGIKPVFVLFTFNAVCVSRVGTETGFLISSGQQSLSGIHSLNGVFLYSRSDHIRSELKTLEWWISNSMLDLLFFLISRLNIACSPHVNNLKIN